MGVPTVRPRWPWPMGCTSSRAMGGPTCRAASVACTLMLLSAASARAQAPRGLERRCRAGDGAACEALGQREEERGSVRRALGDYERACEAHVATSCARAGLLYEG